MGRNSARIIHKFPTAAPPPSLERSEEIIRRAALFARSGRNLWKVGGTSGADSIPKIAPTVEHKITLAYSSLILFGFGT